MRETKKLNRILLILLIAVMPLFVGCPLIDPDGPEDEEPDYTLIAEGTIGTAGGTIDADSFMISIPPGAFSDDFYLEIYASTTIKPFGDYANSSLFRIDGLPEGFTQPLRISIRYHGTLSGDTLAAIGQNMFAPSLNDTKTAYYAPSAVDSSSYLIFEFAATTPGGEDCFILDSILTLPPVLIVGIQGHIVERSANDHFRIVLPITHQPDAASVASFFEAVYDTFQNMGFIYTDRTDWPVNVTIKNMTSVGEYLYRLSDKNSGIININSGYMANLAEIRVTACHEFFHLVQHLYNFDFSDNIWLAEAFAVWSEDKVDIGTNYLSSSFGGNEMEPLNGWQIPSQDHGYGMSLLIKDLVEVYGEGAVLDIYNYIKAGTSPATPVDAVLHPVTEPVGNLWHGLLGAYLLGHYYNEQVNNIILNGLGNYTDFFIINGPADTFATFTDSYKDLSGKLFMVELNHTDINSSASLKFTVTNPTNSGIVVYKRKVVGSDSTAILDEVFPGGSGTVTIPGIRELAAGGWRLIALVTNSMHVSPYTSNSNITLDIELLGSNTGAISKGYIWVNLNHHLVFGDSIVISYSGTGIADTSVLISNAVELRGHAYGGTFQNIAGNVFSGNSDEIEDPGPWRRRTVQSYSITANDSLTSILSFSGNYSTSWLTAPGSLPSTSTITGNDIPFFRSSAVGDTLIFKAEGLEACDHITSLSYNYHSPWWEVPYEPHAVDTSRNRYSTSMTSYDCDTAACYIQVMLIAE